MESRIALDRWLFKSLKSEEWLPAAVPGCVHMDLLRNGKISHPFYGINEKNLQWIDKEDWEYQTVFAVPEEIWNQQHIQLVFDGLDTYAQVYLNDEPILCADNMFRTWRVDVKPRLLRNKNILKIHFRSPIQKDLPKLKQLGYALPATNDESERGELGDKKVSVFARKAPYHYGWDWGPRFVTSGIWRKVWLTGWSGCRITDLFILQEKVTSPTAKLRAIVEIECSRPWSGTIRLRAQGLDIQREAKFQTGNNRFEIDFILENPRLWWCRGLGEPHLYTFQVEATDKEQVATSRKIRTGLRSLRLIRKTDADAVGTSFYFELNGIPVFAKGANHVPNDSFETEVSYKRYEHEILTAVESNMNMLRVWGGGFYENDEFYHLCDEHGMMVWQDFMFACSMYPGDGAFLTSVEAEVKDNVKRLRNHPCIALWCGNNEMDLAWSQYDEQAGWGWKEQYPKEIRNKLWRDYQELFECRLPRIVETLTPATDYWPSSPMQGPSGNENQHSKNTATAGDMHYWDVWHGMKPFSDYNRFVGRFMSEYGFQSFPEARTVAAYTIEGDRALDSEVMRWHQRSGDGNRLIKEYLDLYQKQPRSFSGFLYLSQVLQADAIETAIAAHRRNKPYCMGSLYWQLNDCWPVASWSSMDYYGRWKALQYRVKRCFRDLAVIVTESEEDLRILLVSDLLTSVNGMVTCRLYDFTGGLLWEKSQAVTAQGNAVTEGFLVAKEPLLKQRDAAAVLLRTSFATAKRVLDVKEHYFVPAKDLRLPQPALRVREIPDTSGTQFSVETDVLAKNVWLTAGADGVFSDNDFDLLPGEKKTIAFLRMDSENGRFVPRAPGKVQAHSMADFV